MQEHSHRRSKIWPSGNCKRSPWQGIPRSLPCPPLWLTFCTLLPDGKRNRKYQFVFTMRRCILESTEKRRQLLSVSETSQVPKLRSTQSAHTLPSDCATICHGEIGWVGSSGTYGREEHCTNAAEAGIRTVQPLLHMIVYIPLLYVCAVQRLPLLGRRRWRPFVFITRSPPPLSRCSILSWGGGGKHLSVCVKGSWLTCKQSTHLEEKAGIGVVSLIFAYS